MTRQNALNHPSPRQLLGARGEQIAARALHDAGYNIVAADVRMHTGQVDLIAEEGDDLVFVEVKTRRSLSHGLPAEAITATKRRHLISAAQEFLSRAGTPERAWRIDVVSVLMQAAPPQIDIIRHAVEG